MPKYRITPPDGGTFEVNAPDGATDADVMAYVQANHADAPKAAKPERSAVNDALTGAGIGLRNMAVGAKERLDEGAAALQRAVGDTAVGRAIDRAGAALGMQQPQPILDATRAGIAADRTADAPVLATTAGKVGNIVGTAVPATVAAFLPGGQGLAGSAAIGALSGAVQPTLGDESVAANTAMGAAGGAAGYGLGRAMGAAGTALSNRGAAAATQNAGRDAAAVAGRDAGYVIPPTQTNPTLLNQTLEGVAGKIKTGQKASQANQQVTNRLAATALGLPEGETITRESLGALRKGASEAYESVRSLGTIKADPEYLGALSKITSASKNAADNFPGLAKSEVDGIVESLAQREFSADGAVDAMRILRERATKAYAGGDKSGGKAFRDASDALEGVIERTLVAKGDKTGLADFRAARQTIAKSYSVERALNDATGNVSAPKLAAQLARGKPLSGELEQAARFAQAFPKAAQDINSSVPMTSPLDWSAAMISGNPLLVAARPAVRATILSRAYQGMAGAPSYTNRMAQLLSAPAAQNAVRIGAMSPQLSK